MLTLLVMMIFFKGDFIFAAPAISSVSGMVSNGNTITISGSGFGTTGPTILVFDDFEKGTNGSVIATGAGSTQAGQWDEISSPNRQPRYSNAYSRGTLSMMSNWSDDGAAEGGRWVGRRPISANGGIYVSWWAYLPSNRDVPGTNTPYGANWKTWWLFKYDSSIHGFQGSDYGHEFITNSLPTSSAWYAGPINDLSAPTRLSGTWGDAISFNRGQWWRWEQYMKEATDNSGILRFWETSSARTRQQIVNLSGKPTEHVGEVWDTFRFPGYGRGDTNSQTYYDDIYVATGPGALARVEIGNASTYNASTNLAVATATSWSDTSVQATIRQGSFTNGSAYLYVVDNTGTVNVAGYPVTIGGGTGDTTPPTISLTAPANGATVSGTTTTVSATASDNSGTISGVQFRLDGTNLSIEDTTSPFSTVWNTTAATNGVHTLTAFVRDPSGNTATSSPVSVTVGNVSPAPVLCITITPSNFSQAAYNSYGAPFDAFQTSTNLMNANCSSSDPHTIQATLGQTGDTTRIVYTKGYYYTGSAWTQYTGTCTGALNGDWCQGSVSATITNPNISTASASAPAYFVGMTCSVQGGSWRCGCRDTACTNFYWMIQGAGQ